MFKSRFEDGEVGEIDYSQLEVVVQGVLTGDIQLTADLIAKVDFHCKRLGIKLGEPYDIIWHKHHKLHDAVIGAMRTDIKQFSFQRAYGAGAEAIADATGIPVDQVKDLITLEEKLYPGIVAFNESVADVVAQSRWSCRLFKDNPHGSGVIQCGKGEWWSPTGTRYIFEEHPAPKFIQKRGTMASFSPPEMKNYPVQGFGGEIVQVILGKLFRAYVKQGWWSGNADAPALLVNTVHDCVWNDMRASVRDAVLSLTCEIMESVPEVFNGMYPDLNIVVPFPVEAECGPNMLDLKHWSKAA